MNNGLISKLHGCGGLLVLCGAVLRFFEFDIAVYIFAAGVVLLLCVQAVYLQQVKDKDIRTQRIVRLMLIATLLLAVGAYLMYMNDDRWVVLVLIYALISVFLALRSGRAKSASS